MGCCGTGPRLSGGRRRSALRWLGTRPGGDWEERERAARPACAAGACAVPVVVVDSCSGSSCDGGGDCCNACRSKVPERTAGNPPDPSGTVAGLDRETWNAMSRSERQSWLAQYARTQGLNEAQRNTLYAQALTGGFDTLRGVINTVRDVELERLRQQGATDRTRITGRNDAEVALLGQRYSNPDAFGGGRGPVAQRSGDALATVGIPLALFALLR